MPKTQPSIKVRHAVATWSEDAPRGAVSAFCKQHNVSRAWFYQVRAAAKKVGPVKALEKKPPIALTQPKATPDSITDLLLGTRAELEDAGFDHGPLSVMAKLRRQGFTTPSRATVARIFSRAGVVVPEPRKKPRSAYIRFTYPQPNSCWQIDSTEWVLADGTKVAIFQLVDDHSRLALASLAASGETSEAALRIVATAIDRHGLPQRFLSDNGASFNPTRRGKRGALVEFLKAQGVEPITGKPYKPTTQGKNERFHQTLHKYLHRQPAASSLAVLQAQIDVFDHYYNTEREHQALVPSMTPQEAWDATPRAPAPTPPEPEKPMRTGRSSTQRKVQKNGNVTVLGTQFRMGKDYISTTVNIMHDDVQIMFFDTFGTEIISHPIPPKGQRYVGNDQPRGFKTAPNTILRRRKTTSDTIRPPQSPASPNIELSTER